MIIKKDIRQQKNNICNIITTSPTPIMKSDKKKDTKLLTIGIASIFLFLVIFLAYKYWPPLSKELKLNFAAKNGKIISTSSIDQEADNSFTIPGQIIQSAVNPFTMDIKSGNQIESIVARLRFKTGPKEIKLGVRGNEKDDFTYQPFYQKLLQNCTWNKIEEETKFLYQKVKNYDSIGKLIDNPPDYRQIATYNINLSALMQKILSNGIDTKNTKPIDIKTGLRGTHIFMIRVDKIPFVLKLTKQDFNRYVGEDKYIISINHNGQLIEEKTIPDDGFIGTESFKKEPQSAEVNLTTLKPGIYEINAKYVGYGDDSVITNISSNQSKIVIKNNAFTFYNKPISLYTKTSPLTLTSVHKESLQAVKLNDIIPLELTKERENHVFDLNKLVKDKKSNEFYKLETPKTDVIFSNTGYFAFSPEQYFDPEIIYGTNLNTVASLDEIDYILTSVPKATQEGDWLVSEVIFDTKDIKLDENKKLYFSLEMPDLAKYSGELEIDSFEVEVNLKGALSDKFSKKPTNTPTNIPTPSAKVTPTLTASPSSTLTINKSVKIKVLNAGASAGSAARYATLLKTAGYSNTEAGNYDGSDIKNCTITYPEKYISTATDIEKILKTEYKTVNRAINYKDDQITINIGAID